MSPDLRTRLLSAAVLLAIAIPAALAGGPWFGGLMLIAALIATYEMVRLAEGAGFSPNAALALILALVSFAAIWLPNFALLPMGIVAIMFVGFVRQMARSDDKPMGTWAIGVAGALYIGLCAGFLAEVRQLGDGAWWLALALAPTWLADSGAYVIGRTFGRRPLAPRISPKKTWEGYLGGVAVATAGATLMGALSPVGPIHGAACGLLVGALGTFGDLAESMLKRQANAKDSGRLIPGHGGVFDRIDSMLWAGAIVYYYATLVAGAAVPG